MGDRREILCTVIVLTILVFGSLFEVNTLPPSDAQVPTTLTIITTAVGGYGHDTFPYSITGPTSYATSIFTDVFVGNGLVDFMGTGGPTQVIPGIYSIKETISIGWDLGDAYCTDGSSSFSVDTVLAIQINPGDNIECTFENIIISNDFDGDAIDNLLDTERDIPSNDYNDISFGGTTSGTIINRGDQFLTISDNQNPAGIEIFASPNSGATTSATNSVCSGIATIVQDVGDGVDVTCGSATIEVNSGSADITFIGSGGTHATTTVLVGNSITFNQDTFSFSVPSTNTQDIIIDIDGTMVTLQSGSASTQSFGFLKITKLTTGGDDSFGYTVNGPTLYNPSITTAPGGSSTSFTSYNNLGTLGTNADAFYFENNIATNFLPSTVVPKLNEGVYQKGLATDGVFGEIRLGNEANKDQWKFFNSDATSDVSSINLWIKGDLVGSSYHPIFATMDNTGAGDGFILQTQKPSNDRIEIVLKSGGVTQIFNSYTGQIPDDGNWHMLTVLMDRDTGANTFARIYLDGAINPDYSGKLPTEFFGGTNNFGSSNSPDSTLILGGHIGLDNGVTENGFNVDDVAIWDGTYLAPADVVTLYNAGAGSAALGISPSTLKGYWSFDDSTVNQNAGGGIGIHGPTTVDPGTYSIQETVPAGWNLATATCTDGSSSFSVDTVSGILVDPGDNIQCTFVNSFSVSTPDNDGDGIYNEVDTLPDTFSDDFSDGLVGTSSGTITTRGDQILTITEEPNPAGVRINAGISGGSTPATVSVCAGASTINLTPGDEIVVTCGSVIVKTISGQVEVVLIASDGTHASTSIPHGNEITFEPQTSTINANPQNIDPIIIIVGNTSIPLSPGSSDYTDIVPPQITINSLIHDGNSFNFGDIPSAPTCTAQDVLSGVNGNCSVTGYQTGVGTHQIQFTASDLAGNTNTITIHYQILPWSLLGFYQPVDMNGVVNTAKGGSTVPLKFEVFSGSIEKTSTSDISSFTQNTISCSSLAGHTEDAIEITTTDLTGLQYTGGQFHANWKTPKSPNTCWKVKVVTIDGTSLSAFFKLK